MPGVAGTWKDLTDSVNSMAGNLTGQVRNIAEVTTAVARGDLSRKITVDVKGEILELKNTINTMVDQLNAFAGEVTRVAREVGTDGKLGGQAQVPGVAGTWKDLTDNVNFMASNLTGQVRNIAEVATAIANGDLVEEDHGGRARRNSAAQRNAEHDGRAVALVRRRSDARGPRSRLAKAGWAVRPTCPASPERGRILTDSVNAMAGNLTGQVRNIAEVTTAVARGDLSRKITVDVKGEILELKNTINTMVDQLNAFAAEVTRVAREVGTDGKLGGQAQVPGVAGTWKDLTDNVNVMAANLTEQVRGIVKVVTAVANGELTQKLTVNAKGEVAALAETINNMTGHAGHVRRPGDDGGPRSRRGRPSRRTGQRARRRRNVERSHRQRQPAGRQPDQPGARHRRSRDRRDQGRLDAIDSGGSQRRSGRAERQHQHDDRQPPPHDGPQHRAGLAEDQPRALHRHVAGAARSGDGGPHVAVGTGAAGECAAGRDLSDGDGRSRRAWCCCRPSPTTARTGISRRLQVGEGLVGQVRCRKAAHVDHRTADETRRRSVPDCSKRCRATSSCCRCCSKIA